jgi:uridine kinase
MKNSPSTKLIAIVGGSGAGKTWLADRVHKVLGEKAGRLSLDDFYRDRSHLRPTRRERINYDHPNAIDWPLVEGVLGDCRAGRSTRLPRYDFTSHTRMTNHAAAWHPKPVTLIDGLWLLHHASIRRLFDLKIYVECPSRMRLRRRLERDVKERGRGRAAVQRQFKATVEPMHRRFVAPQASRADLVLRQPLREANLEQLAEKLWALLKANSLFPAWMRETFRAELFTLLKTKG